MCLSVYIASDQPLPLVAWNYAKPAFYIDELKYNKEVVMQFTLPNVRRVGSDAGCGCGFLKDGVSGDELVESMNNYSGLALYVRELQKKGASLEIFSCWEGDQTSKCESHYTIEADDLLQDAFEFKEKALYTLR